MLTMVGIKQLHRDMSRIARRVKGGERIVVMKHAAPMFVLAPYHDGYLIRMKKKKYTLADLKKLQTRGGDRSISKKIDALVYGV